MMRLVCAFNLFLILCVFVKFFITCRGHVTDSYLSEIKPYGIKENEVLASYSTSLDAKSVIECALQCTTSTTCCTASFDKYSKKCLMNESCCDVETLVSNSSQIISKDQVHDICEAPWILFNDHCYFLGESNVTWANAQTDCENKGSNLLKINDATEDQWIKTQAVSVFSDNVWIGANDIANEGEWEWVSDKCPVTYSDWNGADPDNYGNIEHCSVLAKSMSFHWVGVPCNGSYYYICEK